MALLKMNQEISIGIEVEAISFDGIESTTEANLIAEVNIVEKIEEMKIEQFPIGYFELKL